MGPNRAGVLGPVKDPPRVALNRCGQAVTVKVILADAVVDVEHPGQLGDRRVVRRKSLQFGLEPLSPSTFEVRDDR